MDLKKLKADLAAAKAKAAATYDTAIAAAAERGTGLTDAEQGAIQEAEKAVTDAEGLVKAAERRAALTPAPAAPLEAGTPAPSPRVQVGHDNREDRPWAEGPAGLAEFSLAAMNAFRGTAHDPRLVRSAASGLNEAIGADGAFALPVEQSTTIEREMYEVGDLLSRVDVRTVAGNAITYPVMRETSRADSSRQGGVLGYWIDEAGEPTASKFQLAKMELKLKKVGAIGYLTEELMEDAAAMGAELQRAFVDELTFQVEDAIVRGNGTAKPQGFLNAPCVVEQAIETNQTLASGGYVTANISKMWIRMRPRDRANAIWFCNPELEPLLDVLAIPVGTAALEPRFVAYGPDGVLRIKGRPVIYSEYASALGTVGDVVLLNPAKYRLIRKASGVSTSSSIHVRYVQGETALRAIYRVDGQMVPRSAVTPYKGSATTSCVVTLGTRS